MEQPVVPRTYLLRSVLTFVQSAAKVPGVQSISMVGSLTTLKQQPKDVDVLVVVDDSADLAPLASAGRKLRGHILHYGNYGCDIFLANPELMYIGRLCPWKVCRWGQRLSCDAIHCGIREYLHDDLQNLTLSRGVILAPPVELWPRIVTRVEIPADVIEIVLKPLAQGKFSD